MEQSNGNGVKTKVDIAKLKKDVEQIDSIHIRLEKYRWIILGAAIVVGWIVSRNFSEIVGLVSQ